MKANAFSDAFSDHDRVTNFFDVDVRNQMQENGRYLPKKESTTLHKNEQIEHFLHSLYRPSTQLISFPKPLGFLNWRIVRRQLA
ncbi:hypothetical protein TNIN_131521 [Trichonephila inaurata madagascariensis]|uniref:Uncharacterized protein n=1 Tax=Trichonephila inaurata madagascariensis TaxID=2747483 RepID=A0A8X6X786_9ARAC|nr:hypothetical protein TNIN_131521 [Trichonephila inaurata madagascariensis]